MTKTILVSSSTGERGFDGKKKIYEITLDGNSVVLSWGKAEENSRQTQTKYFATAQQAEMFALDKRWEKVGKGYTLVLVA